MPLVIANEFLLFSQRKVGITKRRRNVIMKFIKSYFNFGDLEDTYWFTLSCLNVAPTKRVVIKANDDTRQAEIHTSKNI